MKNSKEKSRVKFQKTLNGVMVLLITFIMCACLGPYVNDDITFIIALLNMIKLIGISLLMYIGITFTNHLIRR